MIENLIESYKNKIKTSNSMLKEDDFILKNDPISHNRLSIKASCYKTFVTELEKIHKQRYFVATGNEFGIDLTSCPDLLTKEEAEKEFELKKKNEEAAIMMEIKDNCLVVIKHDYIY